MGWGQGRTQYQNHNYDRYTHPLCIPLVVFQNTGQQVEKVDATIFREEILTTNVHADFS